MPLYMLDTDTVSYAIRGQSPALDARLAAAPPRDLCISVVTRGELLFGVQLKPSATRLARVIDQFLARLPSLAWDDAAASHFASLAAALQLAGSPIGRMDAMIAGHARALGAVLVTNNTRHFARVANLQVENWTVAS